MSPERAKKANHDELLPQFLDRCKQGVKVSQKGSRNVLVSVVLSCYKMEDNNYSVDIMVARAVQCSITSH